jgi:uncharacterized membrane protein (DUF4010 family)
MPTVLGDDVAATFQRLGAALLLGMLVGLQRQRTSTMAGLRTFPIITLLGTLAALVDRQLGAGGWVIGAAMLSTAAMMVVGNIHQIRQATGDGGITTEAAVLFMFALGAYLAYGDLVIAVALGAGTAVLLQFKGELHGIAARLGDQDLRAIMQFALITCIVLPILPNREFGPLAVLNPFKTWLMVVLIVGISLGGYIVYKFWGARAGILLGGILGGAISSTATTASYARRTAASPETTPLAAAVILIARRSRTSAC